jgi:hypothetical protein
LSIRTSAPVGCSARRTPVRVVKTGVDRRGFHFSQLRLDPIQLSRPIRRLLEKFLDDRQKPRRDHLFEPFNK